MSREGLALPWRSVALRGGPIELGLDGAEPGLSLLEDEVDLILAEPFGAASEAGPLQRLQDRLQPGDLAIRASASSLMVRSCATSPTMDKTIALSVSTSFGSSEAARTIAENRA